MTATEQSKRKSVIDDSPRLFKLRTQVHAASLRSIKSGHLDTYRKLNVAYDALTEAIKEEQSGDQL